MLLADTLESAQIVEDVLGIEDVGECRDGVELVSEKSPIGMDKV